MIRNNLFNWSNWVKNRYKYHFSSSSPHPWVSSLSHLISDIFYLSSVYGVLNFLHYWNLLFLIALILVKLRSHIHSQGWQLGCDFDVMTYVSGSRLIALNVFFLLVSKFLSRCCFECLRSVDERRPQCELIAQMVWGQARRLHRTCQELTSPDWEKII